jgi:spermidine/putrescine ABC transporter ATP-binding subunit
VSDPARVLDDEVENTAVPDLADHRQESVSLIGIHKWFGDLEAIAGIDLAVNAGEFTSILGPSGSGKTTTMRIIGGFEQPDQGRVRLGGRDVTALPAHKRDVNTVFQSYALFPHMTVQRNIEYGLKVSGVPKRERRVRAREALELVRLSGVEAARPHELSGGMRQRVALARALVNRPGVLLLDEPLGALDRKLREEMQVELRQLQRDVGATFIYVTHDQEEALAMSDRVVVMRAGRIEQVGTPAEVYDHPSTLWVAGFVGANNTILGTVVAIGAEIEVDTGAGLLRAVHAHGELRVGDQATVTVRPELVSVRPVRAAVESASSDRGARVNARVEEVLNIGVSLRCVAVTDFGVSLQVVERRSAARTPIYAGEDVVLCWPVEAAHVYGAAMSSRCRGKEPVRTRRCGE